MLRLFVKDNTSGEIHEYGTNNHDALILQDDGSLHYENMQCCVGTKFPKEGYSFCLEDGTIPEWDLEYGVEPYLDIGGGYYTKPKTNADLIRAMSDEELARFLADKLENEYILSHKRLGYEAHMITATEIEAIRHACYCVWMGWLKQPAEV